MSRRDIIFSIHVTLAERERLKRIAEAEDITVSCLARAGVNMWLRDHGHAPLDGMRRMRFPKRRAA